MRLQLFNNYFNGLKLEDVVGEYKVVFSSTLNNKWEQGDFYTQSYDITIKHNTPYIITVSGDTVPEYIQFETGTDDPKYPFTSPSHWNFGGPDSALEFLWTDGYHENLVVEVKEWIDASYGD